MTKCRKRLLVILALFISVPQFVLADPRDAQVEEALEIEEQNQYLSESISNDPLRSSDVYQKSKNNVSSAIPDWLKRMDYGIKIETDQKPRYYLETVQPLYQSADKIDTIFTHDRISIQNERGTYSVGVGYRRLVSDALLLGINNFFDYQDLHKHYRTGVGLEAISQHLEFRANSYFAMSPKRLVEETATVKNYERAVNGGDVELGTTVPYFPWFKVFGGFYHYDFRKFDDMNGWKARGEIKPLKFLVINLETYDDNKGDQEYSMDMRLNLAFQDFSFQSFLIAFQPNDQAYPDVDLSEMVLNRVERNFNIQVEKWTETSGISVEVGRK